MKLRREVTSFSLLLQALLLGSAPVAGPAFAEKNLVDDYDTVVEKIDEQSNLVTRLEAPGSKGGSTESSSGGSSPLLGACTVERGFPVRTFERAGVYHSGPAIHTLVGNIDSDPQLEILVTALAVGPLYAFNADGSRVMGWPVLPPSPSDGAAYPTLGRKRTTQLPLTLGVFTGYFGPSLTVYNGDGSLRWSRPSSNFVSSPGTLADVTGTRIHEIFIGEEDGALHGYDARGMPLPDWPVREPVFGQERHTPAVGDLDGDGHFEILTAGGSNNAGVYVFAYHYDGTRVIRVSGFPIQVSPSYGLPDTFIAIGDVDGDSQKEFVLVRRDSTYPWTRYVNVHAANGTLEWTRPLSSQPPYSSAPALADLDGDGIPEIIVQGEGTLDVWRGDGTVFPGLWPVVWNTDTTTYWLGDSAPVVGDVDGDGQQEIVVTSQFAGSSTQGELRVYNADGTLFFALPLPIGSGAVPAITDIDGDGHNEVIVTGSYWDGISGLKDKVWAFDCGGGGRIEWGQFGGHPTHGGRYPAEF